MSAGVLAAFLVVTASPFTAQAAEPGAANDFPITMFMNLPEGYSGGMTKDQLEEQARTQFDGTRQYWLDQSAGKVDMRLASITWGATPVTCNPSSDERDQRQKNARAEVGYQPTTHSRFFYVVMDGCPFYGVGSGSSGLEANDTQVYIEQDQPENGVWAHEFGHTFGFGHANELYCPGDTVDCETAADGGPGYVAGYGDASDTMGTSYASIIRGLSTPYGIRAGFIGTDGYTDITGAATRTVTIRSRDVLVGTADDPTQRAVRITDPVSGRVYVMEMTSRDTYNKPIWWGGRPDDVRTVNQPAAAGNQYQFDFGVRVIRPTGSSHLLLPAPANADGIRRDVWDAGTTFVSPSGGTRVQVVSTTRTTATLAIRTRADVVAPAAPTNLVSDGSSVTGNAEPGSTVTVAGPDGAAISTAVADPTTGAFTIPLDPALADGVVLTTTATDAADNVSDPATVTVDVPEPDAPAAPSNLTSTGGTVTGTAEAGARITVTNADGDTVGTATAEDDGSFTARLTPAQADGTMLNVTATTTAGGTSAVAMVTVVTPAADRPTPPNGLSSNGTTVTGTAEPGRTVTVTTPGGTTIGTAEVGDGGTFTVRLNPAQADGTVLSVVARGADGQSSNPTNVTVVVPAAGAPAAPTDLLSDGQRVSGTATAGTTIRVTGPDGAALGEARTAADGTFTVTLTARQSIGTALSVVAVNGDGVVSAPATVTVTAVVVPAPPVEPTPEPTPTPDPTTTPTASPTPSQAPAAPVGDDEPSRPTGGDLAYTGANLGALPFVFAIPILAGLTLLVIQGRRQRRNAEAPTE